jgi:hypothetical protein
MTQLQQLQTDLDNSLSDGELLARTQITSAVQYLSEAQRFSVAEIRSLVNEVILGIAEYTDDQQMALAVMQATGAVRWVN